MSTLGQTADDGTQSPYPQPSYQASVAGGISPTARVIPDVSFFGSNGNNGSDYMLCLYASDCVNGTPDSLVYSGGGNPAVAASAFAGIAALVVQAHGPQGNLNDGLYATAAASPGAFHDITAGTNQVDCTAGTPNCGANGYTATAPPTPAGPAYNATAGYDAASGLGSVDVAKLISGWVSGTGSGTPGITLSITKNGSPVTAFQHDDPAVDLSVSVTGGAGTPQGDVAITRTATGNTTQGVLAADAGQHGHGCFPVRRHRGASAGWQLFGRCTIRGQLDLCPGSRLSPVNVSSVPGKLVMLTTDQAGNPLTDLQRPVGAIRHKRPLHLLCQRRKRSQRSAICDWIGYVNRQCQAGGCAAAGFGRFCQLQQQPPGRGFASLQRHLWRRPHIQCSQPHRGGAIGDDYRRAHDDDRDLYRSESLVSEQHDGSGGDRNPHSGLCTAGALSHRRGAGRQNPLQERE